MRTLIALLLLAACCHAETVVFTAGDESFEIDFVTVGSPGNPDDPRKEYIFGANGGRSEPYQIGGVDYKFSMAKFEMSCQGVRIVHDLGAITDPLPPSFCNVDGEIGNYPEVLNDERAVEFVNWLNTSTGYPPAYASRSRRNPDARFFLPTADEFHKAAYYDPVNEIWLDYATEGNVRPVPVSAGTEPGTAVVDGVVRSQNLADVNMAGGLSVFGTMGQTGNATEWEEGFGWFRDGLDRNTAHASNSRIRVNTQAAAGLRIVAIPPIPEPSSLTLLTFALCSFGAFRRRYRISC